VHRSIYVAASRLSFLANNVTTITKDRRSTLEYEHQNTRYASSLGYATQPRTGKAPDSPGQRSRHFPNLPLRIDRRSLTRSLSTHPDQTGQALQVSPLLLFRYFADLAGAPGDACSMATTNRATGLRDPSDIAVFNADVTTPDQTVVLPGETFQKTWEIQNPWRPPVARSEIGTGRPANT